MATHYPDVFNELLSNCARYREKSLDLMGLKAAIWNASQEVVAVQEKSYRDALQKAEGELDILQFTIGQAQLFEETLVVVDEVEKIAREALADDDSESNS